MQPGATLVDAVREGIANRRPAVFHSSRDWYRLVEPALAVAGLHTFLTDSAAERAAIFVFDGHELVRPTTRADVFSNFEMYGNYVVQELETTSPAIMGLAEYLCSGIGLQVRAASYVSRVHTSVLPRHSDDAHVLAMQCLGRKKFVLYDSDGSSADIVLAPGDALLIPEGVEHMAVSVADCMHLCMALRNRECVASTRLLRESLRQARPR